MRNVKLSKQETNSNLKTILNSCKFIKKGTFLGSYDATEELYC